MHGEVTAVNIMNDGLTEQESSWPTFSPERSSAAASHATTLPLAARDYRPDNTLPMAARASCPHLPVTAGRREATRYLHLPQSSYGKEPLRLHLHGNWYGGTVVSGGGRKGAWGKPGTGAVVSRGRGRFRVSPSATAFVSLLQFVRSGAVVIPTSPSGPSGWG
jgi:hypothetical protein